ncbi:MAG: hypothetical protein ACI8VI_001852, partial [Granulosicoccus sp.]
NFSGLWKVMIIERLLAKIWHLEQGPFECVCVTVFVSFHSDLQVSCKCSTFRLVMKNTKDTSLNKTLTGKTMIFSY